MGFRDDSVCATAGVGEWEAGAGKARGDRREGGVVRTGEAVDCLKWVANCDETTRGSEHTRSEFKAGGVDVLCFVDKDKVVLLDGVVMDERRVDEVCDVVFRRSDGE